jgi:ankyrin repeat protein
VANDQVSIFRVLGTLDLDWSRGVECQWDSWSSQQCNVLHLAAVAEANTALQLIAEGCYISDINCRNGNGESPLHLAAYGGNDETVEILLSHGANIDAENKVGEHAVHYAARSGNESAVRALLRNGCSLAADTVGLTPELVALKHGHQEVTRLFKELGPQQGMFFYSSNVMTAVDAVLDYLYEIVSSVIHCIYHATN